MMYYACHMEQKETKTTQPNASDMERDSVSLNKTIETYSSNVRTPELISKTWQTIWRIWEKRAGIMPAVTDLRTTQKEINQIEKEGKMFIYLPRELAIPGNSKYLLLNKLFPETRTGLLKNPFHEADDEYHMFGWIDIEANIETPWLSATTDELERIFSWQNRLGQRLPTYIIGSQFSKLVTDRYFDSQSVPSTANEHRTFPIKRTSSRLLGTRMGATLVRTTILPGGHWINSSNEHNSPIEVRCNENGHISGGISLDGKEERHAHIGGRSEGTKFGTFI